MKVPDFNPFWQAKSTAPMGAGFALTISKAQFVVNLPWF
jgi:hypothetical protein